MRPAILVFVVSSVFAQEKATPGEQTEAARATEAAAVAKTAAEAYKVTADEAGRDGLQLQPNSLLHWSNPVLGSFHGSVFLWTAKGRPEVVASIYKKYVPLPHHLGIEFHSLAEGPAKAERSGKADWSPGRPRARRHARPAPPPDARPGRGVLRHEDGPERRQPPAPPAHPADLPL
jgi:hypothetical protein